MFAHYGSMTYPGLGEWTYMTVHPPPHYLLVGLFSRFGLDATYAAGAPVLLLLGLAFVAVLRAPFSIEAKIAIIAGVTLGLLLYTPPLTIRPDTEVVAAWLCGLIFLESARLSRWNNRRLAIGAFLTAYASILHYWAAVASIGLFIYIVWIAIDR